MGLFDETDDLCDRRLHLLENFFGVIRSFCHGNDYASSFENADKNIINIDFRFLPIVTMKIFEEKMKRIKKKEFEYIDLRNRN